MYYLECKAQNHAELSKWRQITDQFYQQCNFIRVRVQAKFEIFYVDMTKAQYNYNYYSYTVTKVSLIII